MTLAGSRVKVPHGASAPFEVFVSGVPQAEGLAYAVRGDEIVFARELSRDRAGFWRWVLMFFSIAGSYGGQTVDVRYSIGGRDTVATGLEILPPR